MDAVTDRHPELPRRRAAARAQDRDQRRSPGLLHQPDRLRAASADRDVQRLRRPVAGDSTIMLHAKGCENLDLRAQAPPDRGRQGPERPARAPTADGDRDAERRARRTSRDSQVILPDLIRPNAAQFNVPGGLCSDAEFAQRACPAPLARGSARVITPAPPFALSGPVYVVQEMGNALPKLYVDLKAEASRSCCARATASCRRIHTVNNVRRPARRAAGLLRAQDQGRPERHPQELLRRLRRREDPPQVSTTRSPARAGRRSTKSDLPRAGGVSGQRILRRAPGSRPGRSGSTPRASGSSGAAAGAPSAARAGSP